MKQLWRLQDYPALTWSFTGILISRYNSKARSWFHLEAHSKIIWRRHLFTFKTNDNEDAADVTEIKLSEVSVTYVITLWIVQYNSYTYEYIYLLFIVYTRDQVLFQNMKTNIYNNSWYKRWNKPLQSAIYTWNAVVYLFEGFWKFWNLTNNTEFISVTCILIAVTMAIKRKL